MKPATEPVMDAPAYPLFLSLRDSRCLVAGFGGVGRRKAAGLLACEPAAVHIFDLHEPEDGEGRALLRHKAARFHTRTCTEDDLRPCRLVFAATGSRAENARIAALCARLGLLCNCADAPEEGSFLVPASARAGCLTAALSTGGASPALARRWRGELETWLAPRARTAHLMGALRPLILALGEDTRRNTGIFRALAASSLQDCLERGDLAACRALLEQTLPPALHDRITELLDAVS